MRSVNFIYSGEDELRAFINAEKFAPEKEYFIRIHTCIHTKENIMHLVMKILDCLPKSRIIGCSTSGVVSGGEIRNDCCLITFTEFDFSHIKTCLVSLSDDSGNEASGNFIADKVHESVITENSRYMFAFFSRPFIKVSRFVERINETANGLQLIGGIANTHINPLVNLNIDAFVFDNSGVSDNAVAVAVIDSQKLNVFSYQMYVTEPVGGSHTITDADGMIIRAIDGENAVDWYEKQLGISLDDDSNNNMTILFPLVRSDKGDLPWALSYSPQNEKMRIFPDEPEPVMFVPNEARAGDKVKIAYSSVQKNIEVCEQVCNNISSHSAEALFGYICVSHEALFNNCAEWEVMPFKNTNLSGCFVIGEIGNFKNANQYCNYSFVISALSENKSRIKINTDILRENADSLTNNQEHIINYLLKFSGKDRNDELMLRQREIEEILFKDDGTGIDNITKYLYDLSMGRFDKICMITFRNEGLLNAFMSKSKFRSCLRRFHKNIINFINSNSFSIYIYKKNSFIITADLDISEDDFIEKMHLLQEFLSRFMFYSYVPITEFSIVMGEEDMLNKAELTLVSMRSKNIFFLNYTSDLGLEQIHARKMKMIMILNDAIANDRVEPFFQGIRDNKTGEINMYESLMRIKDADGNIYTPYRFMDIAKEYGFYSDISYLMISKVMEIFRKRKDTVTINLNISDIYNYKIVHFILDFLRKAPRPQNYIFELTETEEIEDYQIISAFVEKIHEAGIKIAIDDFGSGFSNIVNIFKVKSDYIKIDGEIVRNIKNDIFAREFLEMIAGWAEKHDKEIIAEFIETNDIQVLIEENSIRYSQGYLFSKPSEYIVINP